MPGVEVLEAQIGLLKAEISERQKHIGDLTREMWRLQEDEAFSHARRLKVGDEVLPNRMLSLGALRVVSTAEGGRVVVLARDGGQHFLFQWHRDRWYSDGGAYFK